MEHLLIHLVLETIQALDRRLQKSLARVVPDLALLRTDPQRYLASNSVRFGPKKRHALAVVIGLACAFAVTAAVVFVMEQFPRPKRPDIGRMAGVATTFIVVLFVVRHLCMKWFVGGTATLQSKGVELVYKDRTLFLPWELFRASGSVFEPDPKVAVVPIDPTVPVALSMADGSVAAMLPDELDVPQAASSDVSQLAFKDQYEVRVGELAGLILEIGEQLNESDAVHAPVSVAAALAMPETDGTLRVQLTQLPFPPFCAGCGTGTNETLDVSIAHKKVRNKIEIPFCEDCARRRRKRRNTGAIVGAAIGIMAGIVLGYFITNPNRDFGRFVGVSFLFSAMFVVPLSAIGMAIGRDAFAPFSLKDYQPEKGTVKMTFRDPAQASQLLAAMGLGLTPSAVGDEDE